VCFLVCFHSFFSCVCVFAVGLLRKLEASKKELKKEVAAFKKEVAASKRREAASKKKVAASQRKVARLQKQLGENNGTIPKKRRGVCVCFCKSFPFRSSLFCFLCAYSLKVCLYISLHACICVEHWLSCLSSEWCTYACLFVGEVTAKPKKIQLIIALWQGHLNDAQELIDEGVNVNAHGIVSSFLY